MHSLRWCPTNKNLMVKQETGSYAATTVAGCLGDQTRKSHKTSRRWGSHLKCILMSDFYFTLNTVLGKAKGKRQPNCRAPSYFWQLYKAVRLILRRFHRKTGDFASNLCIIRKHLKRQHLDTRRCNNATGRWLRWNFSSSRNKGKKTFHLNEGGISFGCMQPKPDCNASALF